MIAYDGFISYSHAKDRPIATALQSVVQRLGKPWYRRRALRLFRDDTSLSATPQLWPSIEEALGRSRLLALLASPEAATSRWVDKEVACWLSRNKADTVLIALTDGVLDWNDAAGDFRWCATTPLPPALKGQVTTEPRWIDLRPYREGASPRDARFAELAANFAAAIRGVPKEDLLSEEVRQQRRALRLASSAALVLVVLLGLASWEWSVAEAQKREIAAERDRAEHAFAMATDTAFGLAKSFRNVAVPITIVDEIIPKVRKLQELLATSPGASPDLRWRQAMALVETAETLLALHAVSGALDAASEAHELMSALTRSDPGRDDYQRSLAITLNKLGDVREADANFPEALAAYREAASIWNELLRKDPASALWRSDLALDDDDIGSALRLQGDLAAALATYREGLFIRQALIAEQPNNPEWQHDLAGSDDKIGDVLKAQENLSEALAIYKEAVALRKALASNAPADNQGQSDLAFSDDKVGDVLSEQGDFAGALVVYQDALAIWNALMTKEPRKSEWQHNLFVSFEHVGGVKRTQGDVAGAIDAFSHATVIARTLADREPGIVEWQVDLALGLASMGTVRDPGTNFHEALAILRRMDAAGLLGPDQKTWMTEITTKLSEAP
jgi:tetratricopeptide (TPR) repeat protein